MIFHFMYRDALDNRISWYVVIAVSLLAIPFFYLNPNLAWTFLFFSYYMFSMAPLQAMMGSAHRSQHIMSRHYLLALPVPRKKIFRLLFFRLIPYGAPLFVCAALMPLYLDFSKTVSADHPISYLSFLFLLLGGAVMFMCLAIGIQLGMEQFVRCINGRQRILLFCKGAWPFALEGALIYGANHLENGDSLKLTASVTLALAIFRYYRTQKRWVAGS
jgi:hypothetical protein